MATGTEKTKFEPSLRQKTDLKFVCFLFLGEFLPQVDELRSIEYFGLLLISGDNVGDWQSKWGSVSRDEDVVPTCGDEESVIHLLSSTVVGWLEMGSNEDKGEAGSKVKYSRSFILFNTTKTDNLEL